MTLLVMGRLLKYLQVFMCNLSIPIFTNITDIRSDIHISAPRLVFWIFGKTIGKRGWVRDRNLSSSSFSLVLAGKNRRFCALFLRSF